MKKKLGPLELWQWIAIGVAAGLGAYLLRRGQPAAVAAATPADATYNPIDPTTGQPYAGGVSSGGATTPTGSPVDPSNGQAGLSDLLNNLGSLEGLLAGLQQMQPGPATDTDQGTVQGQTGAAPSSKVSATAKSNLDRAKARVKLGRGSTATTKALLKAGYSKGQITHAQKTHTLLGKPKNPGHKVTAHIATSRKTASSSAPHNARQHINVAPPSHQRHPPTEHHSAPRPVVRSLPKPKPKARRR
jgi:hypothetical protein